MGRRRRPSTQMRVPNEHLEAMRAYLRRLEAGAITGADIEPIIITGADILEPITPAVKRRVAERPFFPQPKPGKR